jgi:hypothetical protein
MAPAHQHQVKPSNKSPYLDEFVEPEPVLGPSPFCFFTCPVTMGHLETNSMGGRLHAETG